MVEYRRRQTHATRASNLLNGCKDSSRKRNQECDLTIEQVLVLVEPMRCSVTGVELRWEWEGESTHNPWAPSLDRLDNDKGYTLGNVRLVCWIFNRALFTWEDDVFDKLARSYVATNP